MADTHAKVTASLIAVVASLIAAGLSAWQDLDRRVTRMEERVMGVSTSLEQMREDLARIDEKLDKLLTNNPWYGTPFTDGVRRTPER